MKKKCNTSRNKMNKSSIKRRSDPSCTSVHTNKDIENVFTPNTLYKVQNIVQNGCIITAGPNYRNTNSTLQK